MIYVDRKFNREWMRCYICYTDGFVVEWRQSISNKERIIGIGGFNQHKSSYEYKKKGYGNGMYRRILELSRNRKNEKNA